MNTSFQGDTRTGTDEWLTPPFILEALGDFDLDPCSPANRPWPTAKQHFTVEDNGLLRPWFGRVFCNPPYDNINAHAFLLKCAAHGNAIALIYSRTETELFFNAIWDKADAVLFLKRRLHFHKVSGERGGEFRLWNCFGGLRIFKRRDLKELRLTRQVYRSLKLK